jgi:hypothetical protein
MSEKSKPTLESGVFAIKDIVNHGVKNIGGVWMTKFRCRWVNCDDTSDTWEPLENVKNCPILLYHYIVAKGNRYMASKERQGRAAGKGRIRPACPKCVKAFSLKKDLWYIPDGSEIVKKILKEISVGKNTYVLVIFRHLKPHVVHVPRSLMDYYFPVEMALFLMQ